MLGARHEAERQSGCRVELLEETGRETRGLMGKGAEGGEGRRGAGKGSRPDPVCKVETMNDS